MPCRDLGVDIVTVVRAITAERRDAVSDNFRVISPKDFRILA
jgi:hypothetical protein